MKTRSLLLLSFCIPFSLLAQKNLDPYSRADMNLKGNVESFTESHSSANKRGQPQGKPYVSFIHLFNNKGQLIKTEDTRDNYMGHTIYSFLYDTEGRLANMIYKEEVDNYTYEQSGLMTTRIPNNDREQKDTYIKNSSGKIVDWKIYTISETNYWKRFQFKYNNSGQIAEIRRDGNKNSFDTKLTYTYNSYGDVVKEVEFDIKDDELEIVNTYKYEYDSKGNWTSCLQTSDFGDGDKAYYLIVRKYTYSSAFLSGEQAKVNTAYLGIHNSISADYEDNPRFANLPATLLDESFADNRNNWLQSENSEHLIKTGGGVYKIKSKSSGSWYSTIPIENGIEPGQDFDISVTLKKLGGTNDYYFGILIGFDADTRYHHLAAVTGNGQYVLANKGINPKNIIQHKSNIVKTGNATNVIRLQRVKGQFRLYINNQLAGTTDATELYGNRFGFQVWSDMEGLDIVAENFIISVS